MSKYLKFRYILMLFALLLGVSGQAEYKKRSLIRWDEVSTDYWTDYDVWERNLAHQENWPSWERVLRERRTKEIFGKVIACFGECRIYRGLGFFKPGFRSTIEEGDELHTLGRSYVWVFLFDGTLVRLSPDSSISFKEINIGKAETFLHARVNSGNVLWLNRLKTQFKISNKRETDTIYFPLEFYEAQSKRIERVYDEDNLFEFLEKDKTPALQVKRLNELIEENNEVFGERKTFNFLVMPNGTISGYDLSAEMIVLVGGKSYVKKRDRLQLGVKLEEEFEEADLTFYYRGLVNKKEEKLRSGQWYEIGKKGKRIDKYYEDNLLKMGELVTSHITTFNVAKELLLKEYSESIFTNLERDQLALEHAYRLWGEMSVPEDDLALRLRYLIPYTRRIETTNLVNVERFYTKMLERGEKIKRIKYSRKYFNDALVNYLRNYDQQSVQIGDREQLNSTKKRLWKKINGNK